eukprot:scaffold104436_cov66-Phaeocystis_antarctica.AAC.1
MAKNGCTGKLSHKTTPTKKCGHSLGDGESPSHAATRVLFEERPNSAQRPYDRRIAVIGGARAAGRSRAG